MQVIYPRCAGLDVHQKTVVVTVMTTQDDGAVQREQQTFSTMTTDLLTLDDWLRQRQIEVIALESTGVYWRPVYSILEEGRTVVLVNACHMKAVPGRKTDRHRTANGSPTCSVMGCSKPVSSLPAPSARFAS
jgi:transposase